jgi:hypothetical protein
MLEDLVQATNEKYANIEEELKANPKLTRQAINFIFKELKSIFPEP